MANDLIVRGSIGARVEVTLTLDGAPFDLTGATVTLLVRKPGGQFTSWSAVIADSALGRVRYVTPDANVLDSTGRWEVQPRIVTAAGETLYGDALPFQVTEAVANS